MHYLTEDQIESHCELIIDRLDRMYMAGILTTEKYDSAVKAADDWAMAQYALRAAARRAIRLSSKAEG